MQGPAWIGFLRHVPVAQHANLVLVTNNGTEVILNSLVRLERDYMVARGRMAGSQDSNKVIIIPFDQINFLSFAKRVTEEELLSFLGKPGAVVEINETENAAPETVVFGEAESAHASDTPLPELPSPPAEASAPPASAKPAQVSKTMLLARLRARLGNNNSR